MSIAKGRQPNNDKELESYFAYSEWLRHTGKISFQTALKSIKTFLEVLAHRCKIWGKVLNLSDFPSV